jgi:hypothetical protein
MPFALTPVLTLTPPAAPGLMPALTLTPPAALTPTPPALAQ